MSRALYVRGPYDAVVAPTNLREGRAGETLLDIAAVGLCGSDLHYYKDGGIGSAAIRAPFVPGHEFAGQLTEDLPEFALGRGTLVAVDPNHACGHCAQCREGHANLCPNVAFIGAPPHDGAMTERLWVPRSQIVPLPPALHRRRGGDARTARRRDPCGRSREAAPAGAGDGAGMRPDRPARAAGAESGGGGRDHRHRPAGASPRVGGAARRARARRALVADAQDWTEGEGTPLVVEATNAPEGFRDAVRAARIGGRIVLVGIPDGDTYTLPAAEARRRGLKIKFARRMGEVYPRAIALVQEKRVDVGALVTRIFDLSDAAEAFRLHAGNAPGLVKSIIRPDPSTRSG